MQQTYFAVQHISHLHFATWGGPIRSEAVVELVASEQPLQPVFDASDSSRQNGHCLGPFDVSDRRVARWTIHLVRCIAMDCRCGIDLDGAVL